MIYSLRGKVTKKALAFVVIEVQGVGYLLGMSQTSISQLPDCGQEAFVWTYMSVSESGIALFGFTSEEERDLFLKLLTISGIGPKVALSALSSFSPAAFAEAISQGDVTRVATIPGVGKKTASRIVLELKGSIDDIMAGGTLFEAQRDSQQKANAAATDALLSMGFTSAEAEVALRGYNGDEEDVSGIIRYALKRLGSSL